MKKIIAFGICAFVMLLSSCFVFFGDFPGYFEDYTWTEISKAQFCEKLENFYKSGKIYTKADVFKYYPRNNYFLPDCDVEKDEHGNAYAVMAMAEIVDCTIDFVTFDESAGGTENADCKFYICAEDASLLKAVGYHNWWDSCIYKFGWLVLAKKDNAAIGDYEYYYIEYEGM